MKAAKGKSKIVQTGKPEGRQPCPSKALRLFIVVTLLLIICLTFAATQPDTSGQKSSAAPTIKEFFVLQAGWHTGIVLRTRDVSPHDWPEIEHYLQHKWVDIGWGDERFYQHPGNPPLLAAKAILTPTSGALQVTGFEIYPLMLYNAESRLRRIEANGKQYELLCRAISNSFERDPEGNLIASAFSTNTGNFFRARGKYHLFNTCNTWVVKCLKEAGYDVNTAGVITREHLSTELDKLPGGSWEKRP
jgi:uncharacterized protein (TIGR02117 family)